MIEIRENESVSTNSSSDTEDGSCHSKQDKSLENNGSKLSAAAQPFSPGSSPLGQPLSSTVATSVYNVPVSQGSPTEPVGFPSVAAPVPCGPRSPMYYRATHNFLFGPEFMSYLVPMSERNHSSSSTKMMNPHAPEFVPKKAWKMNTSSEDSKPANDSDAAVSVDSGYETADERAAPNSKGVSLNNSGSDAEKSEIARQILLSFIVKSARNNGETLTAAISNKKHESSSSNTSEAIANDSAIIKIFNGNNEKTAASKSEIAYGKRQKLSDVNKNKTSDGEGFVIVTKRRRNRQQFANSVNGLYSQQSICASVR